MSFNMFIAANDAATDVLHTLLYRECQIIWFFISFDHSTKKSYFIQSMSIHLLFKRFQYSLIHLKTLGIVIIWNFYLKIPLNLAFKQLLHPIKNVEHVYNPLAFCLDQMLLLQILCSGQTIFAGTSVTNIVLYRQDVFEAVKRRALKVT